MLQILLLMSCISQLIGTPQEIVVRRDADWPPKVLMKHMSGAAEYCRNTTGIDEELITRFSDRDVHDHPELKCYMKCFLIHMKALDENGKVNVKPMLEVVVQLEEWEKEILINMGTKCLRQKIPEGIDLCEKAFLMHKCLKEADPVHFFLV